MIVGGLVVHNTDEDVLRLAVESLRSTCDRVIAFDDFSNEATSTLLCQLVDECVRSESSAPHLLVLRRATLYEMAERMGASWFVYHDDDEQLAGNTRESLRSLLETMPDSVTSVLALSVQFYWDTNHIKRRRGPEIGVPIAWRCQMGFSYLPVASMVFRDLSDKDAMWHCPRPPMGAERSQEFLEFPKHALLHHGRSSVDRAKRKSEWYESSGFTNPLNKHNGDIDLLTLVQPPAWEKP